MKSNYNFLVEGIDKILSQGKSRAIYTVNTVMVQTYWLIGRQIVEYEQHGKERAGYGEELMVQLSRDLRMRHGKGFGRHNIQLMRQLYLEYPIRGTLSRKCLGYRKNLTLSGKSVDMKKCTTVSGKCSDLKKSQSLSGKLPDFKLSWSHYVELLSVDDVLARGFYENECLNSNWSVRELRRQIGTGLFYRSSLSKDEKKVLEMSRKGEIITKASDIIRDPYILEFLDLPENESYSEKRLESEIINNLQKFLLELGRGFTFVGRQYRITIGNNHFYVDLVFYHRILKCFVLIDLKLGRVDHKDVGQMNLYLNYFKEESENTPIGIILGTSKDELVLKYALGGLSNKLFIQKYKVYMPKESEIRERLRVY